MVHTDHSRIKHVMSRRCPWMSLRDAGQRSHPEIGHAPASPGPRCSACGWFGGRRGRVDRARSRSRRGANPQVPSRRCPETGAGRSACRTPLSCAWRSGVRSPAAQGSAAPAKPQPTIRTGAGGVCKRLHSDWIPVAAGAGACGRRSGAATRYSQGLTKVPRHMPRLALRASFRRRRNPSSTAGTPGPRTRASGRCLPVRREDLGDEAAAPVPLDHLPAHLDPGYECIEGGQRHHHQLLAPPLERLVQLGSVDPCGLTRSPAQATNQDLRVMLTRLSMRRILAGRARRVDLTLAW